MTKIFSVNFRVWLVLIFAAILLSRVMFLSADIPSWSVEIEEKASGYSARSKVLFNTWDSGGGWYQPSVYMPLSNILTFISFSLFGIGPAQLRLPFALASSLSYFIFYLIIKEELNRKYALLGVLILSSIYPLFLVNRSAINENLFLPLVLFVVFFHQKSLRSGKAIFYLMTGFFASLNGLVKIYGLIMIMPPIISTVLQAGQGKNKFRSLIFYLMGVVAALIFGAILVLSMNNLKTLVDFYYFYTKYDNSIEVSHIYKLSQSLFLLLGITNTFLTKIVYIFVQLSLNTPRIIFALMPFLFVIICFGLLFLLKNRKYLSHFDYFIFLIILAGITAVVLSRPGMYYKNLIFIIPPLCFIPTKAMSILDELIKGEANLKIKENQSLLYTLAFIYILILFVVSLDVYTGNSLFKIKKPYTWYEENWSILRYLIMSDKLWLYVIIIISGLISTALVVNATIHKILHARNNFNLVKKITMSIFILFFLHSMVYLAKDYVFSEATNNISNEIERMIPRKATIAVSDEDIYRILAYNLKNKFIFLHYIEQQGKEAFQRLFSSESASFFAFLNKKSDSFDPDIFIIEKCDLRNSFKEYRYFHKRKGELVVKIINLSECSRSEEFRNEGII